MEQESEDQGHLIVDERFFSKVLSGLYGGDREVFVRELVSNAITAIRRREIEDKDFARSHAGAIEVRSSRTARTIEISDNGCGIAREEFRDILARMGRSLVAEYRDARGSSSLSAEDAERVRSLIGFFGIGLYSAFLVARTIEVTSRTVDGANAYRWTCHRDTRWRVEEVEREGPGTTVRLLEVERAPPGGAAVAGEDVADESRLMELARRFAYFCPYAVTVGGRSVRRTNVPWEGGAPTTARLLEFHRERYPGKNEPLVSIPIFADGQLITARGALFITASPPEEPVTLLVQGIPVGESVEIAPAWTSGFLMGAVECPDIPLRPSRAGPVAGSAQLEELRQTVRQELTDRLRRLVRREPETWRRLWEHHGDDLLRSSLEDADLARSLGPSFLFPTSRARLRSITEYAERNAPLSPNDGSSGDGSPTRGGGRPTEITVWYATDTRRQAAHLEAFERRDLEVLSLGGAAEEHRLLELEPHLAIDGRPVRLRRVDRSDDSHPAGEPGHQEGRVLRDLLSQTLAGRVEDVAITSFEPARSIARIVRKEVPEEIRRIAPALEEIAKQRGSAPEEEWPEEVRDAYARARAAGIPLDDLLDQVSRRRLLVNWSHPTVQTLASWAEGVGPRTEGEETVAAVSGLLFSAALLGSGEPLDGRELLEAANAIEQGVILLAGRLDARPEPDARPDSDARNPHV